MHITRCQNSQSYQKKKRECQKGVLSETMSVKEGDTHTLNPELTEIKKDDVIDWRFGETLIARVRNNNNASVYEDALDGKFRGRLNLDGQTGNLTITNIKTTDAGDYEVSNSINTIKKTFSVTVSSPVVTADEVKSVTVKKGDTHTLNPGLTEIKKDDVIDWRFGETLIARVRSNNIPSVYEDALNGKFRGRLKLDGQTGKLTIANIKTTDAGDYEVSNSINTIKKTFSVSVNDKASGLSPGEIAGIVVVGVLSVAAAVVIYYMKKSQVL